MYQSVMAKRQGIGSSGTGFSFVLAKIKEIHPDKNICLAEDLQTTDQYQVGLNKRGETVWPQVGDTWILDRSLGHWALQTKVTDTEAPVFTGYYNTMDADLLRLVLILKGLGLVQDGTTTGPVPPTVTGSRNNMSPITAQIIDILAAKDIITDGTTAATGAVGVWQTPTLQNSWVAGSKFDVSETFNPPIRYRLTGDNHLEFSGWLNSGTSTNFTVLFSLASGYIPLWDHVISGYRQDAAGSTLGTTIGVKILGSHGEGASAGQIQLVSGSSTNVTGMNIEILGRVPLD